MLSRGCERVSRAERSEAPTAGLRPTRTRYVTLRAPVPSLGPRFRLYSEGELDAFKVPCS